MRTPPFSLVADCPSLVGCRIRKMASPNAEDVICASSGVHVVLPEYFLGTLGPVATGLIIPRTKDGRVLFALPWLGGVMAGTTDEQVEVTDVPKPTSQGSGVHSRDAQGLPQCRRKQSLWALAAQSHSKAWRRGIEFPTRAALVGQWHLQKPSLSVPWLFVSLWFLCLLQIAEQDVLSTWSGLRPLVKADGGKEGGTQNLVRDHAVIIDEDTGLVTITGGSGHTYRRYLKGETTSAHLPFESLCAAYQPGKWALLRHRDMKGEACVRHVLPAACGLKALCAAASAAAQNACRVRLAVWQRRQWTRPWQWASSMGST